MATLTNQPIDQPTDRANIVQTALSKVGEQKAEICNFKPMQSIRCGGVHRTIRKECPTLSPEEEANQFFAPSTSSTALHKPFNPSFLVFTNANLQDTPLS